MVTVAAVPLVKIRLVRGPITSFGCGTSMPTESLPRSWSGLENHLGKLSTTDGSFVANPLGSN